MRDYGLADGVASKEFRMQTAPELAQAGLSRKAVYNFYRKLSQCFCYTYQGKKGFGQSWRIGAYAGEFIFDSDSGADLRHWRV